MVEELPDDVRAQGQEDENIVEADPAAEVVTFGVKREGAGKRLDLVLTERMGKYSRSEVQRLIRSDKVTVNGHTVKTSYAVSAGDEVRVEPPAPVERKLAAEYIPITVIYEDETMLVVNKPPGIVVHPARGHWGGTLINAVLYHCHNLSDIAPGRPGIVHRLDRDTTGVILFMKEDVAHRHVARQFEQRRTKKEYLAIVEGEMKYKSGKISFPLGRHRTSPRKMTVRMEDGREAQTFYEVLERFRGYTFVKAMPRTGRTHQIRVHLAEMGHPVAADELYSKAPAVYLSELRGGEEHASDEEPLLARQALHAHRLEIEYPGRKKRIEFVAELPEDMGRLLEALRKHRAKKA